MPSPLIITVIPPTVCLVLALYLLFQGRRDWGIRFIILLLLALVGYGVVQVVIQSQPIDANISRLVGYRMAFWGLIVPLSYHSILAFLKDWKRRWIITLTALYALGVVIIILCVRGYSIYQDFYFTQWGWDAQVGPSSWFFWVFLSYLLVGLIAFFGTLIAVKRQTDSYRVQKLAHAILVNFLWGGTFTIVPYFILSWLRVPSEILLAYAGNVAMFIIVLTIQKYEAGKMSYQGFLTDMTPHLPCDTVMVSPQRTILWQSKGTLMLTGFTSEELLGKGYDILFADYTAVAQELARINGNPNYLASLETECYTSKGSIIRLRVSVSGLRNAFNDLTAYLLVFNLIAEGANAIGCLQSMYNLTDREKDIAVLLLSDCSNAEICEKLFISINTVKSHAKSIYMKTSTGNRKEFINLCEGFKNQK